MKLKSLLYIAAIACASPMFISCQDDVKTIDDGWDADTGADGPPVIYRIAASSDIDKTLDEVALDQCIAIFGDNLWDVQEIKINDLVIDPSTMYVRRHRIDLVVPRQLPGEVNNTITICTKLGETSAPVAVALPVLTINGFSNDFAYDGDTVKVTGKDFDLYGIDSISTKATFGGHDVKIFDVTSSSFKVQVPAGLPTDATSYLNLVTPQLQNGIDIPFREPGFAIMTNDPYTWPGGWWAHEIHQVMPDDEPAAPLFQWYVHVKNSFASSWSYDNVMITHFMLGREAQDVVDNPQDYVVKFELLNPAVTPMARYIRIGIAEMENENLMYMWDPVIDGASVNTMGEWQTISLEVTDVFKGPDGTSSLHLTDKPRPDYPDAYWGMTEEWNNFKIAVQRELPGDVDFYFWNIRIVKKLDYSNVK